MFGVGLHVSFVKLHNNGMISRLIKREIGLWEFTTVAVLIHKKGGGGSTVESPIKPIKLITTFT